jgi:hypothetical protein
VKQSHSGPGDGGPSSAGVPAGTAAAAGVRQEQQAEAAALATRLIMQTYGPVVSEAARAELEGALLALAEAALSLRSYPLLNSDEPMTVNGRGPREPA